MGLGWFGIVRLGLVQTALGAIVVLATSTLNRVMVVELALPAMLPGVLVGLHYAVQLSRPRWGYGSDAGGQRTPWILGGMAVLSLGGAGAAVGTALMGPSFAAGMTLALISFVLIGVGVGAAGTSLLALLSTAVAPRRRAAAGAVVWLMMIAGFVVTATGAGALLDPYTPLRLVQVTGGVAVLAFLLATLAVWGVERSVTRPTEPAARPQPFLAALSEVWAEPQARHFTIFVFASMLAYSAQDLILEPFAGHVFSFTPGESTRLAGVQNMGVFCGMALVGTANSGFRIGTVRGWVVGGCLGSAAALVAVAGTGFAGLPLRPAVFCLGLANGTFAVAAIGAMMGLAGQGREQREGTRMGLWGAAQAIAFGLGGLSGAAAVDLMRSLVADPAAAYGTVFVAEAGVFVVSALLALRIARPAPAPAAIAAE